MFPLSTNEKRYIMVRMGMMRKSIFRHSRASSCGVSTGGAGSVPSPPYGGTWESSEGGSASFTDTSTPVSLSELVSSFVSRLSLMVSTAGSLGTRSLVTGA